MRLGNVPPGGIFRTHILQNVCCDWAIALSEEKYNENWGYVVDSHKEGLTINFIHIYITVYIYVCVCKHTYMPTYKH